MARKKIPTWLLILGVVGAWYWYKKQQKAKALAAASSGADFSKVP